jgi:hypothetical protein
LRRNRISPLQHQLAYQTVGLADDAGGIIDKPALQDLPFLRKSRRFRCRQYDELQPLDASLSGCELGLSLLSITNRAHHTAIFRAKARLEMSGFNLPPLSRDEKGRSHDCHDQHGADNQYLSVIRIHGCPQ